MFEDKTLSEVVSDSKKILYHHVDCTALEGLTFQLSDPAKRRKRQLSVLGISWKESVKAGLLAVDKSPFKTVFVVDEESGRVLFALTKNEEYVEHAKKKRKDPPPPPPPPESYCCQICQFSGGTSCDNLSDGSCICYGADRGAAGAGSLDDPLEVLAT